MDDNPSVGIRSASIYQKLHKVNNNPRSKTSTSYVMKMYKQQSPSVSLFENRQIKNDTKFNAN